MMHVAYTRRFQGNPFRLTLSLYFYPIIPRPHYYTYIYLVLKAITAFVSSGVCGLPEVNIGHVAREMEKAVHISIISTRRQNKKYE
jgi:hypothetical protein